MDTYSIAIFMEINNRFSNRLLYITFFRVEKPDNLYVYAPENKTCNVVYYIEKFSKYLKKFKHIK